MFSDLPLFEEYIITQFQVCTLHSENQATGAWEFFFSFLIFLFIIQTYMGFLMAF